MRCKEYLKIYLAGVFTDYDISVAKECHIKYLLQTFYDLRKMKVFDVEKRLDLADEFLLDSGAFTFMNSGKKVHWKAYVDEYIEFINKYDIQQFFELDLYTLSDVGIEKTIKMRKYIEHRTGKKSIPVFHACMGMKMYRELCKEYDYIGIGASGLTEECRWTKNKTLLKQMVSIANSYNTKVHGLGYTTLKNINNTQIPFYSVDSSSWSYGKRYGIKYYTKHGKLCQSNAKEYVTGARKGRDEFADINIPAWCKMQRLKDTE